MQESRDQIPPLDSSAEPGPLKPRKEHIFVVLAILDFSNYQTRYSRHTTIDHKSITFCLEENLGQPKNEYISFLPA